MSSRLFTPTLIAAAVACSVGVTPPHRSVAAASASLAATGVTTAVAKTIRIDGQEVEVVLEVTRSDAAISPPSTSATVTLRTRDGQDLPVLNATRVRLERARSPRRSFVEDLIPLQTFRFDPTMSGYAADGYPSFRIGTKLKAAIRLETDAGVMHVRFSDVRVGG
ncbi:MAG: hypothetical protein IT438_15900 [Phycisphaerales bacterium]|nr:hypothetical protein [Phycisphaerales bacterium]